MNGSEYPDDASKGGMRKGIIIGIVVIVTAASFTLGFFVGKRTGSRAETLPALVEVAKPRAPETPQHESLPVQTVVQTPLTLSAENTDDKPSAPAPVQGAAPEKSEKTGRAGKGSVKEEAPAASAAGTQAAPKKEIIYTVQLGAFKSRSEADNVKAKFDKKGYKTYITAAKNRGEKVYKVRTGEFTEKKDAEILSLKLKKADGLAAFVTFKNE